MSLLRTVAGLLHADDFSSDTQADYTFHGSSTVTTSITGGRLRLSPPDDNSILAEVNGVTAGRCFAQVTQRYPSGTTASYSAIVLRAAGFGSNGNTLFTDGYRTDSATFEDIIRIGRFLAGAHTLVDQVAESGWPTSDHHSQLFVDDGVQAAWWSVGPNTLSGADTEHDAVTGGVGFWGQRFSATQPHIEFDNVVFMRDRVFIATGLTSGQKLKIFDSGDNEIFSATESGGTATIQASREAGASVNIPVDGWAYATITDSGDVEVERFTPGVGEDAIYPGDVFAANVAPPSTPTVTIDEAHEQSVDASTGAFVAGDGGTHTDTQWQIREQGGATVYDPGDDDTNLTSITGAGATIPLAADVAHEIRARHKESNGVYSEWSSWTPFTTAAWNVASIATITVASAEVGAALAGFPVAVDLSAMGSSFWANVDAAGDEIRVFNSDASRRLPVDVVRIDVDAETGWAWFLADSLSASTDTVFNLDLGGTGEAEFDTDDVWADYEAVVMLGQADIANRVDGVDAVRYGATRGYVENTGIRHLPALNEAHQGVAWDGTHYYLFGDSGIRKYNASWSLVDSNADPEGDASAGIGGGVTITHMGDGCVVAGSIWVGMVADGGPTAYLVEFDASDLSFVQAYDISTETDNSAASVAFNPDDGLLYVATFDVGDAAYGYDPDTGVLGNTITYSTSFGANSVQGITFHKGLLYVSDANTDGVHEVALDGTVHGAVWTDTSGFVQGLDFNDDGLIWAIHASGGVSDRIAFYEELSQLDLCGGGGTRMDLLGHQRLTVSVGADAGRTTWTAGVSYSPFDNSQDSQLSFCPAGTADTHRAAAAVRTGSALAVWDVDNGWLEVSPTYDPALEPTMHRLHIVYVGTTERRIYSNGGDETTDSAITAKGGGGGAEMFFVIGDGVEGGSSSNWAGRMGFAYLRAEDLGADWIAAEHSMLADNGTFLTVTELGTPPGRPNVGVGKRHSDSVDLFTSPFVPGEVGDEHGATQWEFTTDDDPTFAAPIWQSGDDTEHLTFYNRAGKELPLPAQTVLRARARHKGTPSGLYSDWSSEGGGDQEDGVEVATESSPPRLYQGRVGQVTPLVVAPLDVSDTAGE